MRVCILGNSLSGLTLAKALVNQKSMLIYLLIINYIRSIRQEL